MKWEKKAPFMLISLPNETITNARAHTSRKPHELRRDKGRGGGEEYQRLLIDAREGDAVCGR